jgi:flagellar biosynthesis protein FliQ
MTTDVAFSLGASAAWTTMLLSAPLLVTSLVVGSLVSVLQTATVRREARPVFVVPKILGTFLIVTVLGAWMLQMSVAFGADLFLS